MRDFLDRHGLKIAVAVLLIAGVSAYCASSRARGKAPESMAYFIDEETNDESVLPMSEEPPLSNKDGKPTVVKVVKFSCDGGKTVSPGYYEKYSAEAKSVLETCPKDDPARATVIFSGLMVRSPEAGSAWVAENSPEGQAVMRRVGCPGGGDATVVTPPAK